MNIMMTVAMCVTFVIACISCFGLGKTHIKMRIQKEILDILEEKPACIMNQQGFLTMKHFVERINRAIDE
jgi:hypothetical protein